jgi:hypothetical protein
MRTFEEILADAPEVPAFSNSTQWDIWSDEWCARCQHDVDADGVDGEGCPVSSAAMFGRTPVEWLRQPEGSKVGRFRCTEFVPRGEVAVDAPAEPAPVSVLPGQLDLFGGAS